MSHPVANKLTCYYYISRLIKMDKNFLHACPTVIHQTYPALHTCGHIDKKKKSQTPCTCFPLSGTSRTYCQIISSKKEMMRLKSPRLLVRCLNVVFITRLWRNSGRRQICVHSQLSTRGSGCPGYTFWAWTLEWGVWWASRLLRFNPGEKPWFLSNRRWVTVLSPSVGSREKHFCSC